MVQMARTEEPLDIVLALSGSPMFRAKSKVIRVLRAAVLFALVGTFMIAFFAGECAAQSIKIVGLGAIDCGQFIKETDQTPMLQRDYLAWAVCTENLIRID